MNCNTFRNKNLYYNENSLTDDALKDMEKHKTSCKSCSDFYEDEMKMNKDFIDFFSVKDIDFNSSRMEILNNIDKGKYKRNAFLKMYSNLNIYKKQYIAVVACFLFIFLGSAYFYKICSSNRNSTNINSEQRRSSDLGIANTKSVAVKSNVDNFNLLNEGGFTKSVDPQTEIDFNKAEENSSQSSYPLNPWKTSTSGQYSACIEEKNLDVGSGVRKIYFKESNSAKLWSFSILENQVQKNTPMYLEWVPNEENLLVLIGTQNSDQGGSIYSFNVNTGVAKLLYNPGELQKVKDFTIQSGEVMADIIVFEDSSQLKFHTDKIVISSNSIKSMMQNLGKLPKEASLIYEYQENINNNRLEVALKLISQKQIADKTINYQEYLYGIRKMNIKSLKIMAENYTINDNTKDAYEHKAFLAEVDYKLKEGKYTKVKQGKNDIMIILAKESIDSSWKISEIKEVR